MLQDQEESGSNGLGETGTLAAVDVKRAADLYAEGWTLRRIGAELGVRATTVSDQLRRAGVTMRRGGAFAHPASTHRMAQRCSAASRHAVNGCAIVIA